MWARFWSLSPAGPCCQMVFKGAMWHSVRRPAWKRRRARSCQSAALAAIFSAGAICDLVEVTLPAGDHDVLGPVHHQQASSCPMCCDGPTVHQQRASPCRSGPKPVRVAFWWSLGCRGILPGTEAVRGTAVRWVDHQISRDCVNSQNAESPSPASTPSGQQLCRDRTVLEERSRTWPSCQRTGTAAMRCQR